MSELHYQLDLLKAMNQKLSVRERMYRLVCDNTANAFLYYSFDKDEVMTLGRWQDFFDFDVKNGKDLPKLFDSVDETYVIPLRDALFVEKTMQESAAVECHTKDKKAWLRFQVHIVYDENKRPTDKIVSIDNITRLKVQNEELSYMAYYDGITGLYNRNNFVRLLGEFVRKASEREDVVSVMVIDIDDFKKVSDGMGLVVGDELIQQFGCFLKEFSDENVIVCRMESDVFCIAVYAPTGEHSVEHIQKKIQERISEPFRLSSGQSLKITVSIGIAQYPEASNSALELINCAEIVMFRCKMMGKNTVQYFDTPILKEFLHNIEIENKLKEAVFRNNFLLHFQPQYYTDSKRLRGMEALIRWRDNEDGMISPATFIPIAEKNGAIIPIGNWVVERSIEQYARWSRQFDIHFTMSINISALQYSKKDFVDGILKMIRKYQVEPSDIELEITESILIDDFDEVSDKLKQLREYGIRISLDDFGTGFSSLAYLKKLPIDTLKIDKSFIDTVLTDSATRIITESIINMVSMLGLETIAEGVEQEDQLQYLNNIGCDVIQGYLLGKPQPSEEIEKLLKEMQ
ncbi:MAG: bifunctional diguanylate cyclase/phosphodiesterase [Bacteroidales bacterium]|nr:bifunctional diguanylate cyclase/phosphodiesterase [Lachnoclostridium sp.]MCM1384515.1 bifunctional diguanylate cyclase/phosphodiesterase [Lachnoclostridium sp.]MCM1464059.1 bifunctional diguanylate cyclase/phosphodiesterase [Bacteroidales bacterium]